METPEIKEIGNKTWGELTPQEKETYTNAYDKWRHASKLHSKAVELRDSNHAHNVKGETKGERGQRAADYRNPRYSGENGMYIKDRRAQQDAENGYNIAINKAIRRNRGTN